MELQSIRAEKRGTSVSSSSQIWPLATMMVHHIKIVFFWAFSISACCYCRWWNHRMWKIQGSKSMLGNKFHRNPNTIGKLAPFRNDTIPISPKVLRKYVHETELNQTYKHARSHTHVGMHVSSNFELLTPFSASLRPIEYHIQASQWATNI